MNPRHPKGTATERSRRFPCPGGPMLTGGLVAAAWCWIAFAAEWEMPAKLAVGAFAACIVMWSTTTFAPAWIALAAVAFLLGAGVIGAAGFFKAMTAGAVWLVIGAFVIGAAVTRSGLAARATGVILSRAKTVGGACWWLSAALVPLSFLVPSTSGRAAVCLPVHHLISVQAGDRRVSRAMALLIPSIILTGTIVSLTGAGSHLLANDLLEHATGRRISFAEWMLHGLPFGLLACAFTCWAVTRMFMDREVRALPLRMEAPASAPMSRAEKSTLAIATVMLAMWMTTSWHGIGIAAVAMAGAVLLALPGIGVIGWRNAIRAVSWKLVLFVGAALALGNALMDTGAAEAILRWKFSVGGIGGGPPAYGVLLPLAIITLTSHLYITSHIARAAALVPSLLVFAESLSLDPVAVMFIGTVGMNFCLTFSVSSKALLMFQDPPGGGYGSGDLLRLSLVCGLAHLALIVLFHATYWKWTGLTL